LKLPLKLYNFYIMFIRFSQIPDLFDLKELSTAGSKSISKRIFSQGVDPDSLLKINLYINVKNDKDFSVISEFVKHLMASNGKTINWPYAIVPCGQLNEGEMQIELLHTDQKNKGNVVHKEFQNHSYSVLSTEKGSFLFSGGIRFYENDDFVDSIQRGLDFVEALLDKEEMQLEHVVSHLNLIGGINDVSRSREFPGSNYSIYKAIRDYYFDGANGVQCSSVGLGVGGFGFDFFAYKSGEDSDIQTLNEARSNVFSYRIIGDQLFFGEVNGWDEAEPCYGDINAQVSIAVKKIRDGLEGFVKGNDKDIQEVEFNYIRVFVRAESHLEFVESFVRENLNPNLCRVVLANPKDEKCLVVIEGVAMLR